MRTIRRQRLCHECNRSGATGWVREVVYGEGTVGPRSNQPEPTESLVIGTIARFPIAVVVTAIGGITRCQ